jgi:hypothetical protein
MGMVLYQATLHLASRSIFRYFELNIRSNSIDKPAHGKGKNTNAGQVYLALSFNCHSSV